MQKLLLRVGHAVFLLLAFCVDAETKGLSHASPEEQRGFLFGLQSTLRDIPYLAQDAREYEQGNKHEGYEYHPLPKDEHPMEYQAWPRPITDFTNYVPGKNPRPVEEFYGWHDDEIWILGGLNTWSGAQYPHANRPSPIHFLAISKASIWNAASLTPDNVYLISRIKEVFFSQWYHNATFRNAQLDYALRVTQEEELNPWSQHIPGGLPNKEAARQQWEELKRDFDELNHDDCEWQFGFHMFPTNSISHFHMHIYLVNEQFLRWSNPHRLEEFRADSHFVRGEVVHNFVREHGPILETRQAIAGRVAR